MIDGAKVRMLRDAKGYSLRVLAAMVTDAAGGTVSAQALGQVEGGHSDLSVHKTAALAAVLGVGISDILLPLERHEVSA